MDEQLTFGGFPVEFERRDDEVYVHCKGVVGTLSQAEEFINDKLNRRHYFGTSKIRNWRNNQIRIDCLQDSRNKFNEILNKAKQFKNEDTR